MTARRGSLKDHDAGTRAVGIDRELILGAAQRILDTEGLGALTLRRIGAELGADPTAVYRHFRGKDAIVTELADRAFSSIPVPDPALPWPDRLRQQLRSVLDLYRANPDFGICLAHQADDTPGLERIAENLLALLADAGLGPRDRALVYQLVTNYAVGSGLFIGQLALDDWGPETIPAVRRVYAALPPEDFPHCVESAPFLFPDQDEVYDLGVVMLIDAIIKLAGAAGSPAGATIKGRT